MVLVCQAKSALALAEIAAAKSVNSILDNLKKQLSQRGARGIIGLQRKFKIMDDDGSQSLSFAEFKKAMQECALSLNDQVSGPSDLHFHPLSVVE